MLFCLADAHIAEDIDNAESNSLHVDGADLFGHFSQEEHLSFTDPYAFQYTWDFATKFGNGKIRRYTTLRVLNNLFKIKLPRKKDVIRQGTEILN